MSNEPSDVEDKDKIEGKKKDESHLSQFVQVSSREAKNRTPENLICAKLYRAGTAKKLTRVSDICEAASNALILWPNKFKAETTLLDVLSRVATAFKDAKRFKGLQDYSYYYYVTIPWSFKQTLDNFKTYIQEWLVDIPEYWRRLVENPEPYRIYTTTFTCPYCKEELLTFKYGTKTTKNIDDFLQESPHRDLIGLDQRKLNELGSDHAYYAKPPILNTKFLNCPKCKKSMLLKQWKDKGVSLSSEPKIVSEVEKKLAKYKFIIRTVTAELPQPYYALHFWSVTNLLTTTGYHMLKGQFVAWANPIMSKLEMEISKNISKKVWDEFFKGERTREREEASETAD